MSSTALKIMVLAGGPDREREVSLVSGRAVTDALEEAGHEVRLCDVGPEELSCLDEFERWGGQVVFPALHGTWGEGGALQQILEQRAVAYVGSPPQAADRAMDKAIAKQQISAANIPTPQFEVLEAGRSPQLEPPLVLKPLREGSSIDMEICRDQTAMERTLQRLRPRYPKLLAERFVSGKELTVGIIGDRHAANGCRALPPIQIIPAEGFYDYQAKYERDDTRYLFEIDLPAELLEELVARALRAHRLLGCRHLSRVDFIADAEGQLWFLEINTIPGFTTHSLVPMAARKAGLPLPALLDQLVQLAAADTGCEVPKAECEVAPNAK